MPFINKFNNIMKYNSLLMLFYKTEKLFANCLQEEKKEKYIMELKKPILLITLN